MPVTRKIGGRVYVRMKSFKKKSDAIKYKNLIKEKAYEKRMRQKIFPQRASVRVLKDPTDKRTPWDVFAKLQRVRR